MGEDTEIVRALGRLEGKVDQVLLAVPAQDVRLRALEQRVQVTESIPAQEERIRSLEQSRARQGGMAAAIASAVSLAMGLAGYFVHKP